MTRMDSTSIGKETGWHIEAQPFIQFQLVLIFEMTTMDSILVGKETRHEISRRSSSLDL